MSKVYVEGILLGHAGTDANLRFNECLYVSIPKRLVHQSIPLSTPEVEWSEGAFYTMSTARHLAIKYGLEMQSEKGGSWVGHSVWSESEKDLYRLRKPVSAEEKVIDILRQLKVEGIDDGYSIKGKAIIETLKHAGLEIRFKD